MIKKIKKGFSLIEIVIAIGIFSLVSTSVAIITIDANQANRNTQNKILATQYIDQMYKNIVLAEQDNWIGLNTYTSQGSLHFNYANNSYSITTGAVTNNQITTYFNINPVYRDASGNIQSSGTLDTHSKYITFTASYPGIFGNTYNLSTSIYINDWNTLKWTQTTLADFNNGTFNLTTTSQISDGEVRLANLQQGNWQYPALLSTLDLPNSVTEGKITFNGNYVYMVVKEATTNNVEFYVIDTSNKSSPMITSKLYLGNTYDIYDFKNNGNYVFVGTSDITQSIISINATNPSAPVVLQSFNATNIWSSPNGFFIANNMLYLVTAGSSTFNEFFVLNIQNPGSMSKIGSLDLTTASNVAYNSVYVYGTTAYVAASDANNELYVVDVTTASSPNLKHKVNLTGTSQALSLYVLNNGQTLYAGCSPNGKNQSMYIIDVSNQNSIKIINTINVNITVSQISASTTSNFMFLAGSTNPNQFSVLDISNPTSPTNYSTLTLNGPLTGVSVDTNYAYVSSLYDPAEFQIIFGGRGGSGTGQGYGNYEIKGDYTSQVFDTGSSNTQYDSIDWSQNIPANTSLQLQIKYGNTTTELNANPWIGPDGTSATFFTNNTGTTIPQVTAYGKRYVQYKAYMTSNGLYTPYLQLIDIYYIQ